MTNRDHFKAKVCERARSLVHYIDDTEQRIVTYRDELAELRELCPWAFDPDTGAPLPDETPTGGRMI